MMERHYPTFLLIALIGIAIGIAGFLLEQWLMVLVGCFVIPAGVYLVAVLVDIFRQLRR